MRFEIAAQELVEVQQVIRSAEARLGRTGRVLVRLSGTEPVARVMVEGHDHETVERLAREIALAIEKEMG